VGRFVKPHSYQERCYLGGLIRFTSGTAENIIVQFDDIGRKSEVFRYPKDKKGKVTLPPMQIDMIRLKGALGWLSQFLDGWSVGVYEYKHAPRE
jgi:hypothetical protein